MLLTTHYSAVYIKKDMAENCLESLDIEWRIKVYCVWFSLPYLLWLFAEKYDIASIPSTYLMNE